MSSGSAKLNKHKERELVNRYSSNEEGLSSRLGDALKAALGKQEDK